MKPFLMGLETEYAISGRMGEGAVAPEVLYSLLRQAVRQVHPWLGDTNSAHGSYLANGSRLYLDCGGHPEYATPECLTPTQLASHDKAGERILESARLRVLEKCDGCRVTILKNNVGPAAPSSASWGNHESYTCWVPLAQAAPQLIPHLVSRIFYAGAGLLVGDPEANGFELSQRARHLVQVISGDTTHNRAIFCTRIRMGHDASSAGWVRAHLIGKDSQRSPFATYLTFATTGLLFLLVNEGRKVGQGLALADPLNALRTISRDPFLRTPVPLADGRRLTALEIQESYLAECEREVPRSDFPEWTQDALRHWRTTLALAREPLRLAGRLDAYCKLLIFEHELLQSGYDWGDLQQALRVLAVLRKHYPENLVRALFAEDQRGLPAELRSKFADAAALAEVSRPGQLKRLHFATRLQALDQNFHELGGLYDQVAQAVPCAEPVVSEAEVERARHEPPAGGRAARRGEFIKTHQGEDWICHWQGFQRAGGESVDLRDPFAGGSPRHPTPT